MLEKFDKNKNPFTIPNNYFEGLTESVMNNLPVEQQEKKEVRKVKLLTKVMPWVVAAVIVLGVFVVSRFVTSEPDSMMAETKTQEDKKQLAYNNAEDYLLFLEDELTESLYEDVLFDE